MQFWQPGWKLCCHKSKNFMFRVRNKWELAKVSKNYFYPQIDTLKTKSTIFDFDTPAQKFFAKHGKCSFKVLKNLTNKENFQKFDFLIDIMRRKLHFSILISLPKTFSPSTVNVRSKFRIVWNKNRTFKKKFLKMFFWTRRLQFWETGRSFSATVQKKFLLKLCHFYYHHLEDNSYIHLECLFENPCENSVATNPKNLCSKSEKNENLLNFQKKNLSSKWYSEDKEYNFQFWYPCPKIFRQARWMFVQKNEEFQKKSELSKVVFLLEVFLWTRRMQF